MAYKTILLHLEAARNIDLRIQFALGLAKAERAHLIGVAPVGRSRYVFESALSSGSMAATATDPSEAHGIALSAVARFEAQCRQEGWTAYDVEISEDDAFGSLSLKMRYSDLLILGQYDADYAVDPLDAGLARDMLLASGGPVLLIPKGAGSGKLERRALISWNGSVEARRAVRDALPLLQYADAVNVAVFSPTGQGEDLGTSLLAFLRRHGISAGLLTQAASYREVQKILVTALADTKSNLLVMGGYGHSPFQEAVLGGVTRAILHAMPVPVFMSH